MYIPRPAKLLFTVDDSWNTFLEKFGDNVTSWPRLCVERMLACGNVSVAVLHSPTIKPLDEETILAQAAKPGRLVIVAENHSSVGGLCEAVASLLMRNRMNVDFDTVALPDAFLDAGALPTLHERYGISTAALVEKIRRRI